MTGAETAEPPLMTLMRRVAARDLQATGALVAATPGLARAGLALGQGADAPKALFLEEIEHHLYEGDTALHVAAAAHDAVIAERLLAAGADPRARNRRGAEPLHYAADGRPGSPQWNPAGQAAAIARLIAAGADPNAADKNGAGPLHRAVRARCAEGVRALLAGGADPQAENGGGSTPMKLARLSTGRGGSGAPEAKAQQSEIQGLLQAAGAR